MSTTLKGTLITLIAGIAQGLSGVSGQYLMVHGFSAIGLTNLRLLFSGIVLIILSYVADKRRSFGPLSKINLPTFPPCFCLFRIVIDSADLFRGDC